MITPIDQIRAIFPVEGAEPVSPVKQADGTMFGSIFQNAINNVRTTDAEKTQAQYLLATGQLDNPATAMIASSKNQIAVSLLVQLRNKALDAYSELTRINM